VIDSKGFFANFEKVNQSNKTTIKKKTNLLKELS